MKFGYFRRNFGQVYATDCPGLALRNLTAANSGGDAISVSASPAA